jgi:hypothetical protein
MLDEHLKWEAFSYVAGQDHTPNAEVIEWAKKLSDLNRQRKAQQDMASWDGADLAAIRAEVARLGREIDKAERALAQARSASVVEDTVNALRSELSDQEGAEWWEDKWTELGLDGQRQLLGNLHIQVDKGRGIERVRVSPR